MAAHFSESTNGYPLISVDPPFAALGELLQAAHSISSAQHLLDCIREVRSGRKGTSVVEQDYACLTVSGKDATGYVVVQYEHLGKNEECGVPLEQLAEIVEQWVRYLQERTRRS